MLEEVGSQAPTGAPEQVGQPGLELVGVDGLEAQVVEQVLTQLELAELVAGDDQQHGGERDLTVPQMAAEANAPSDRRGCR